MLCRSKLRVTDVSTANLIKQSRQLDDCRQVTRTCRTFRFVRTWVGEFAKHLLPKRETGSFRLTLLNWSSDCLPTLRKTLSCSRLFKRAKISTRELPGWFLARR